MPTASIMKTVALFGKKTPAAPAKAGKKATTPARKSGSSGNTGGWLGSGSKNINLDKW